MSRAAGTTRSLRHSIYQKGSRQLTGLRQCQQGTHREVTTEQPHGPAISQTALPEPLVVSKESVRRDAVPTSTTPYFSHILQLLSEPDNAKVHLSEHN